MAESSTAVSTSPPFTKDQLHVTLWCRYLALSKGSKFRSKFFSSLTENSVVKVVELYKSSSSSLIAAAATQGNVVQTRPKSNTITGVCICPIQSLDYRQAKQLGACEPYTQRRPRSHTQPDRTPTFLITPKTPTHGGLIHPFLPLSSFQLHSMLSQRTKESQEEVLRFPASLW